MISFEEALSIVLSAATPLPGETCSLALACGRILAEDIRSDSDIPPFNKSAVDGFACRMADISHPLMIIETIPAGRVPSHPIGPGQCARIMTGAMVPEGTDTVIMVEDTEELPEGRIRFIKDTTALHICCRGEDIRKGDLVLVKGSLITPPAMAVLASVGAVEPIVCTQPSVAMIATGDELVAPDLEPGPAQIRNSNSSQLIAQVEQIHLKAVGLGISGDSKETLFAKIEEGLTAAEVLILTGGVSMGDFDYVPDIMKQHGIEILFKSVAIQPGRPTVFGRRGHAFVFGLPGNPVSSFVVFEILVKPFLYKLMGHDFSPPVVRLPLGSPIRRRNPTRKSFLPVCIRNGEIFPVEYHGSAHIHAYSNAHGLMPVGIGNTELKQGELQDVRLL
ncbi:MAG: molybdopterin molybdenumtransferase MoeA [Bacteroidetes bacterium]|nr:MAG: molybdopterin molybdenumtransferase MoeA [Bacteroidota bacterium]